METKWIIANNPPQQIYTNIMDDAFIIQIIFETLRNTKRGGTLHYIYRTTNKQRTQTKVTFENIEDLNGKKNKILKMAEQGLYEIYLQ